MSEMFLINYLFVFISLRRVTNLKMDDCFFTLFDSMGKVHSRTTLTSWLVVYRYFMLLRL